MKKGDKLIKITRQYGSMQRFAVVEIVKENKLTYKLSNGDLVYKDDLRLRESRDPWSPSHKFTEYSESKINELKEEIKSMRYSHFKKRLRSNHLDDIDLMKMYINEMEVDNEESI